MSTTKFNKSVRINIFGVMEIMVFLCFFINLIIMGSHPIKEYRCNCLEIDHEGL